MKSKIYSNLRLQFVFIASLLFSGAILAIPATNYYPRSGNTDLSKVAQWSSNASGVGGTSPANFTASNQVFNITGVTNSTPTIAANWTVSGANSGIIIGDGTNPVNFTIPASYKVTGTLKNITASATLTILNKASVSSIVWPTDLDPASTLDFLNLGSFTLPILIATVNGYGNIILDNSSVNNVIVANVSFAGNLTLQNTGSFNSTFLSPYLRGNANQTISGNNLTLTVNNFIDTLKTSGNITLAPNTPINFDKDIWLKQSGPPNQFNDGGNTLSCLGNLNMSGLPNGYNFTGTMIIAGSGAVPQILDDDNQYSQPGSIVAELNNLVINCNDPVEFITNATNEKITINGNFIIASSGNHPITLCTTNAASGYQYFSFLGDFINNQNMALTFNTTTIYTFSGSVGQTISTVATHEEFTNLTIHDSSGITLGSPIWVAGTLNLFNGVITANDTTDILYLDVNATNPGGGSSGSYVSGPVAKVGNSQFQFPVGGVGRFMPLGVSTPASSDDTITVDYKFSPPANPFTVNSPLTNVSTIEYWNLTQSVPNILYLTLYWQNGYLSGIYNYDTTLRVARYDGAKWNDMGNSAVFGLFPGEGSVTSSVATPTNFMGGEIAFGSQNFNNNPLPVTLTSFTADYVRENNSVLTQWTVASQLNNKEFVVEKTLDGMNYTEVATVEGAGTTPFPLSYSAYDYNPTPGTSYYRLKQIDVDGNPTIFSPVPVSINDNHTSSYSIYPNPAGEFTNLNYYSENGEPITVTICDISGRIINSTLYSQVKPGENNFIINTSNLSNGIYLIQLNTSQKTNCLKFVKQ